MSLKLDEFVINNGKSVDFAKSMLSEISNKLLTYDIDKHINKKGLFNKKKYLSIFDAYMDYYKITMDLEPMVNEIKNTQNTLSKNSKFIEEYSNDRKNYGEDLKKEISDIKQEISHLKNCQDFDNNLDSSLELSNLETKLYNKNIELKLIEQEYLSIMLIIRTNVVLENTISDLINYGIPQWKKQIKISIDLMSDYNKNQMNKNIIINPTIEKEIDNIKRTTNNFNK